MTSTAPVAGRAAALAALALVFNALVWGTSWWPFRWLQAAGLHPLWATALIYTLASTVIVAVRPRALGQVLRTPALWVLVAAAGTTNAAFNWGVVIGDVVRVVLLFYLMPLWTVLLARLLLGERFTAGGDAAHRARPHRRGDRALAGDRRCRAPILPASCRCRARSPTGWAWSAASRSRSTT